MGQGLIVSYTGPSEPSYPHGSLCVHVGGVGITFLGVFSELIWRVCVSIRMFSRKHEIAPASAHRRNSANVWAGTEDALKARRQE